MNLIAAYILIIVYLTNVLLGFIFKPKRQGYLACGLFGYCGSEAPDIDKIKILGLFNQERGTDSCGLAINDVVTRGVDNEAKFQNFIQSYDFYPPTDNFTVIGHTRKSTHGMKTEANAHPFEIYKDANDADPKLIFAHNGVIKNWISLCNQYGVDHTKIHVDSLGLGSVIAKEKGNIKVLTEYRGGAALMFYALDNPNSLYLFKGASKAYSTSKVEEERPLFYWKVQDKNQIYVSSMKEALYAIGGGGKGNEVLEVEPNKLHLIQNGKFVKLKPEFSVFDRSNIVNDDWVYNAGSSGRSTSSNTTFPKTVEKGEEETQKTRFSGKTFFNNNGLLGDQVGDNKPIDTEPIMGIYSQKLHGNRVYFWRGRYYVNGHMAGSNNLGLMLNLDNEGIQAGKPGFKVGEAKNYFFVNGLLCNNEKAFELVLAEFKNREKGLASKAFQYGESYNKYTTKDKYDCKWLSGLVQGFVHSINYKTGDAHLAGNLFTGSVVPRFSNKKYTFKFGDIVSWEVVNESTYAFNVANGELGNLFANLSESSPRSESAKSLQESAEIEMTAPWAPNVPQEEPEETKETIDTSLKDGIAQVHKEAEHLDLFLDAMSNIEANIQVIKEEVPEDDKESDSFIILTKLRGAWNYLHQWYNTIPGTPDEEHIDEVINEANALDMIEEEDKKQKNKKEKKAKSPLY